MTPENIEELLEAGKALTTLAKALAEAGEGVLAIIERLTAIAHEESVTLAWEQGQLQ